MQELNTQISEQYLSKVHVLYNRSTGKFYSITFVYRNTLSKLNLRKINYIFVKSKFCGHYIQIFANVKNGKKNKGFLLNNIMRFQYQCSWVKQSNATRSVQYSLGNRIYTNIRRIIGPCTYSKTGNSGHGRNVMDVRDIAITTDFSDHDAVFHIANEEQW